MVPRLNAAAVKHSIGPAKDEINVTADRAAAVILGRVQPGGILARAAEAVLLTLLQGQGSGEKGVLIAVEVYILHQHTAGISIDGKRLTGLCTVTGVILDGQVAHDRLAAAQKQRFAAEGAGLGLARPRVTATDRGGDNGGIAVLALNDIVSQFDEGPLLIDAVLDVEAHRQLRRFGAGRYGFRQGAVIAVPALVHDQCFSFGFSHQKNPFIKAMSLAARAGTASSRSTGRAGWGS